MALVLRSLALTDVGLRRTSNQDSGYASPRLLAIADGMGGAAAGDLASAETMNIVRRLDRDLEDLDPLEAVAHAVLAANRRLGDLVSDDPSVEGMGTTLEAMLWDGEKFSTAHIGDSRAYRLRDGVLTQLNPDHTFVQSLVDEGRISQNEARTHPHRSLLLRVLLGRDDNEADLGHTDGQLGDRFLLCSDGLSDMVDDDTIAATLGLETLDIAATELIRLALEGGGHDNVTVVLGELIDDSDADPDAQPFLVGSAAGGPRPRTGRASSGPPVDVDPEEQRYAPRPPSRFRSIRWLLPLVLVVSALVGAGFWAYDWSQRQYFIGERDGFVAIYKGVQADIPGLDLSHLDSTTAIDVATLTEYSRGQVQDGDLTASSREEAMEILDRLKTIVAVPTPTPTPTSTVPSPTPTATGAAT